MRFSASILIQYICASYLSVPIVGDVDTGEPAYAFFVRKFGLGTDEWPSTWFVITRLLSHSGELLVTEIIALHWKSSRTKTPPNQALEPTSTGVTPRAYARVAPPALVPHL